tara:strand:- start:15211 stop:15537 length:327 start_codon:yes stop_codon:yes gene_type:complete
MNIQEKALSAEKFFDDYRQARDQRKMLEREMESFQAKMQQSYHDIARMDNIIQQYITTGRDIMTCILEYDEQNAQEVSSLSKGLGYAAVTKTVDIGMGTINLTGWTKK